MKLNELLANVDERAREKFEAQPKVVNKTSLDLDNLPVHANTWHHLDDLVAVFFDLKSSTELAKRRTAASTASIYDAGVGGVVKILEAFNADFVDIQGDGGFGLFWGGDRYLKALCAAVSVRTFSDKFTDRLTAKWPEAPSTGFKVGVASGPILVKKVGLPKHLELQEPVWAGRPVNYAAKAAQQTTPENIVVTGSVWDQIRNNDYIAFSCGCAGGSVGAQNPTLLWEDKTLDKIPDDERYGQSLKSGWCENHGEEYCTTILDGETDREDVLPDTKRKRMLLAEGSDAARVQARRARQKSRHEFTQSFKTKATNDVKELLDSIIGDRDIRK